MTSGGCGIRVVPKDRIGRGWGGELMTEEGVEEGVEESDDVSDRT